MLLLSQVPFRRRGNNSYKSTKTHIRIKSGISKRYINFEIFITYLFSRLGLKTHIVIGEILMFDLYDYGDGD